VALIVLVAYVIVFGTAEENSEITSDEWDLAHIRTENLCHTCQDRESAESALKNGG
jgi:hypothetical protein